jgi:hypothetical protein
VVFPLGRLAPLPASWAALSTAATRGRALSSVTHSDSMRLRGRLAVDLADDDLLHSIAVTA